MVNKITILDILNQGLNENCDYHCIIDRDNKYNIYKIIIEQIMI